MSEEALGRRHNAGEGYAFGDVPDKPSVADGRCEHQRQDAVGVPDGCRSKSFVGQAMHPARNVRVGDPGQGHEFPARQYLATERDLVAPSSSASAAAGAPASAVATFAHRDLGQGRVHPLAAGNGDLLRSQPLLGVTLAREVSGVLAMVCVAVACPPLPVRTSLDVTGRRRPVCSARYAPLTGRSGF